MTTIRTDSTQYVTVTFDTTDDLTTATFAVSFNNGVTWWAADNVNGAARILLGPAGVTQLAAGTYAVVARITDLPEVEVIQSSDPLIVVDPAAVPTPPQPVSTSYATLADVAAKWRPLPSATDIARATALLEEAEALLDSKLPDLAANITAGTVKAVLAKKVVTDAVIRVLGNPSGVTMQTLGPESVQFGGVRTLGTVAFTKDELETLHPADPDAPPEAGGFAVGTATLGVSERVTYGLGLTEGWV